jgi:acyl carrier protein
MNIDEKVARFLEKNFQLNKADLDDLPLSELQIDSIAVVDLIFEIEENLAIDIKTEEIDSSQTLAQFIVFAKQLADNKNV